MSTKYALTLVAGLAAASTASAATFSGTGGAIPDGSPAGTTFTLNVAGAADILSFKDATLNMNHTWLGDLIVQLTSPDGTTVTLLDRPGVPEASTVGADYDLGGDYTFVDGGAAWPQDAGSSGAVWAPGTYGLDNTDGSSLADFDGEDPNGDWTLFVSDNAGFDTGSIGDWSITFNEVPAPGAAALFGLGGLVAARRRR